MTPTALKLLADFNRRFTSLNDVDVPARVSVPRDDWRTLHAALTEQNKSESIGEVIALDTEDDGSAIAVVGLYNPVDLGTVLYTGSSPLTNMEKSLADSLAHTLRVLDSVYLDVMLSHGCPAKGLIDSRASARANLDAYDIKAGKPNSTPPVVVEPEPTGRPPLPYATNVELYRAYKTRAARFILHYHSNEPKELTGMSLGNNNCVYVQAGPMLPVHIRPDGESKDGPNIWLSADPTYKKEGA